MTYLLKRFQGLHQPPVHHTPSTKLFQHRNHQWPSTVTRGNLKVSKQRYRRTVQRHTASDSNGHVTAKICLISVPECYPVTFAYWAMLGRFCQRLHRQGKCLLRTLQLDVVFSSFINPWTYVCIKLPASNASVFASQSDATALLLAVLGCEFLFFFLGRELDFCKCMTKKLARHQLQSSFH